MFIEISFEPSKIITIPYKTDTEYKSLSLFDTGANIPVWCSTIDKFKEVFPNAKLLEGKFSIIFGFGSKKHNLEYIKEHIEDYKREVYIIPELKIFGNIKDYKEISFINVPVVIAPSDTISSELILPRTLFSKCGISIDMGNGILKIVNPHDKAKVECNYSTVDENCLNNVQSLFNCGINSLEMILIESSII